METSKISKTSNFSQNNLSSGSISKRKKDSNNRNSMLNGEGFKWSQEDCWVIIYYPTSCNDKNKHTVLVENDELHISMGEEVMLSKKLFANVVADCSEHSVKSNVLEVKLMKHDPDLQWSSLERVEQSLEEIDSVNQNNFNNNNKNLQHKIELCVDDIKNNHIEREDDHILFIVYVKGLTEETLNIVLGKKDIRVTFKTANEQFLNQMSKLKDTKVTSDTLFCVDVALYKEIKEDECSFKCTPSNLEIKLAKLNPGRWNRVFELAESKNNIAVPLPPPMPQPLIKSPAEPKKKYTNEQSRFFNNDYYGASSMSSIDNKGSLGLANIGNTCFMNSVLQTLINTRELREYFCSDISYMKQDLNTDNPLGQGGSLAIAFTILMKTAWSGNQHTFSPIRLKNVMSQKANQFCGFQQHDAQEFMVELLDGLHEDLNRIRKKPYCAEPPDLDGWDDADAAKEAWRLHKMRNDSVIDDLFKGQFRSALTCHECNKISVKFDEFCCLSVPIPKDYRNLEMVFIHLDPNLTPVKLVIRVQDDVKYDGFIREVSTVVGLPIENIQIIEVNKHKIAKRLSADTSLKSISSSSHLIAYEVMASNCDAVVKFSVIQRRSSFAKPTKCASCGKSETGKISRCTKCLRVGYCTVDCQKKDWGRHSPHCTPPTQSLGTPFIVSLPKDQLTYSHLKKLMARSATQSVQVFTEVKERKMKSRMRNGSVSSTEMSDEENEEKMEVETDESLQEEQRPSTINNDWGAGPGYSLGAAPKKLASGPIERPHTGPLEPLFDIFVVSARGADVPEYTLALEDTGDKPLNLGAHHHLALQWRVDKSKENHCSVISKDIRCELVKRYNHLSNRMGRNSTSLKACMDLFTQPENLSEGDCWKCPRCKKPVEATKHMSLWKLPPILIVQLKRFSFKYVMYSDKIDKFVDYPINGLDVSSHIAEGGGDGKSTKYDLYGVVNHVGRLMGGHYTAYARTLNACGEEAQNEIDWRLFDDSMVRSTMENNAVSSSAYLLLYRRRDTPFDINSKDSSNLHQIQVPCSGVKVLDTDSLGSMSIAETEAEMEPSTSATSTINTNSALCGNLVSNISVDDSTLFAGSNSIYVSAGSDSTTFAGSADNVNYLPSGGVAVGCGELDDPTPMSVSSTSQPSTSSSEELSTNKDDLD